MGNKKIRSRRCKEGKKERIVKKFLLYPRRYFVNTETRWLEFAYIREKVRHSNGFPYRKSSYNWVEVDFATEDDYLWFIKS